MRKPCLARQNLASSSTALCSMHGARMVTAITVRPYDKHSIEAIQQQTLRIIGDKALGLRREIRYTESARAQQRVKEGSQ